MQYLPTIARVLLGLYFLVFGLNGFFHFIPQPPMPDEAGKAIGAIFTPSYQFNLVKAIEILGGLALLSNRFVGLALVLLAVITVQILLFHLTYTGIGGSIPQLVFAAIMIYVMMNYKDRFDGILKM
jgi:putative oxidoreductase